MGEQEEKREQHQALSQYLHWMLLSKHSRLLLTYGLCLFKDQVLSSLLLFIWLATTINNIDRRKEICLY